MEKGCGGTDDGKEVKSYDEEEEEIKEEMEGRSQERRDSKREPAVRHL